MITIHIYIYYESAWYLWNVVPVGMHRCTCVTKIGLNPWKWLCIQVCLTLIYRRKYYIYYKSTHTCYWYWHISTLNNSVKLLYSLKNSWWFVRPIYTFCCSMNYTYKVGQCFQWYHVKPAVGWFLKLLVFLFVLGMLARFIINVGWSCIDSFCLLRLSLCILTTSGSRVWYNTDPDAGAGVS